jgi:hypothetical protein
LLLYFAHPLSWVTREGYIVGDYGKDVVVRLNNGKEIVESRDDVLIYD